jgi:hypothetical protein
MMKQYRMQTGTSTRIYYVLTVKDDGAMTLTFHGTDREMTEVVTTREDGWIVTPHGGLYPPVSHNRWQEQPHPQPLPRREGSDCASRSTETEARQEQCEQENPSRARRKPRRNTTDIDAARNQRSAAADNHHDTDTAQPLPSLAGEGSGVGSHTSLWPAVAAFAAACVALAVVYESGLLIPVGLIGAVAGGILR